MTLHVSLPKELENLVHNEVNTRLYGSASELVRDALRRYFHDEPTPGEIAWLRAEVQKRLEGVKTGAEQWEEGEDFCRRMEEKYP